MLTSPPESPANSPPQPAPLAPSPRRRAAWIAGLIIFCLLLALAFCIDARVAQYIAHHPPFDKHSRIVWVIKWPGNFLFTLAIAALLVILHRDGRRAAAQLILAALFGGIIYSLVKWIAGRPRPSHFITPFAFHPFIHGLPGLWNANNLGFPSGHACLSFATAVSLGLYLPRWRWLFFLLALIVCAERIGENAHYVSDVLAGIAFGVLSALLAGRVLTHLQKRSAPG